jgi:uncharacterized phage protein gp47/JayE
MPLSLGQLLKKSTETQLLAFLLDTLESIGFVTTSWQEGSIQRNILQAIARTYSDGTGVITTIVENTIVKPRGLWLDLVGFYRFGILRLLAVATRRMVAFTSAASAPAHTILAGSYVSTAKKIRYRVITETALAPGTTELIEVEAEFAGIAGNVPSSTPLSISTPAYTGVTVAFTTDPLTQIGVDIESDDRYWTRCQLRWAELTYSVSLRAYELWALTGAPSVRRVKALNNYPTEGLIRVILDPGEPSEITDVENYISTRIPPNDYVTVSAASVVVQPITYAPRVPPTTTDVTMNAAIQAMLDALPIGGIVIAGAVAGRMLRESITETLLCSPTMGVQSTGLTVPAGDVVLGATDVVQGAYTVNRETVY